MKTTSLILLTLLLATGSFCQETTTAPLIKNKQIRGSMERTLRFGLDFPDYPEAILPLNIRDMELPAVVDNALFPYLRPVFTQSGASCGQSSSVAYNFCYEINRLRNLPSDTSINQYPDHFVWNFMNATTPYYGFGVSYFHTFDVLYDAGCPTEDIYGPITMDDNYYWMDGYEGYYQAMHNRITGINSIRSGTPEGLLNLKHWLHNHHEGSPVGGVASFYAGMPDPKSLPAGTPEAGKHVQIAFQELASHAMTIVGYNDSIRYDVNNDGLYTNHIDITNDGVVDMQDWEIGGLKYVNSYGNYWADSGFCYMLYRTLALKYGLGGVWNNSVHILHPDTASRPLLTIKATIEHNKRGRIRVTAGISSDTSRYYPEHTMSFSVFNYQGLDYNMEGNDLSEGLSLEFGLDITPLLNFTSPGSPSRIFLIVDEKDTDQSGKGKLINYSVMSYLGVEPREFVSTVSMHEFINNGRTLASVVVESDAEPLVVIPEGPIVVNPGTNTEVLFTASGGFPPYTWTMNHLYHESGSQTTYIEPVGEQLIPTDNGNGYAAVPLPFNFPFYGRSYDTLYMHVNGYLMFEKQDMPYFYLIYDEPYLRQISAIAGYMNKDMGLHEVAGNLISFESSPEKVDFNWRISDLEGLNTAAFTISVFPDGEIRIYYGLSVADEDSYPVIGISNGNRNEVLYSKNSGTKVKNGQVVGFKPANLPSGIYLSENGTLSVEPETPMLSAQLILQVSDSKRLTTRKDVLITTGPEIIIRLADSLDRPVPGVAIPLQVEVKNHSIQSVRNLNLSMLSVLANATISGGPLSGIEILPGQSAVFDNVFSLKVHDTITQPQVTRVLVSLSSENDTISKYEEFPVALPLLVISPPVCSNENYYVADTEGEFILEFIISNYGNASTGNLTATIGLNDAYVTTIDNPVQELGAMKNYSNKSCSYRLKVNEATPGGRLVTTRITLSDSSSLFLEKEFDITIGKPVILLIDVDKNHNSAIHLAAALRRLNTDCKMVKTIDSSLLEYDYNFLFLGHFQSGYILNTFEDSLLVESLNRGKNLYVESGSLFKYNPPTRLLNQLRVEGEYFGWLNKPDTIVGIQGTQVEGIQFKYLGDMNKSENLLALEPAIPWFADKNTGYDFTVALDSGHYRSIASSIEFGGTFMFDSPERPELIRRYLEFFGYNTSPLAATFQASDKYICKDTGVGFLPVLNGTPIQYNWVFEGGTPPTWDGPAPFITYETEGVFSASLTITDETGSNTFSLENLITVENCLGIEDPVTRELVVYPNPAHDVIHIALPFAVQNSCQVVISDMQGRVLYDKALSGTGPIFEIPVSNITKGIYIVRVTSPSWAGSSKLMVN